jgi:hypothetical protein
MRKAISLWQTSQYWTMRAKGALRHAKYKEMPAVRARRIKTIEADKRKRERTKEECEQRLLAWLNDGNPLTHERARAIANFELLNTHRCYTLAQFPRNPPANQYEDRWVFGPRWAKIPNTRSSHRTRHTKSH